MARLSHWIDPPLFVHVVHVGLTRQRTPHMAPAQPNTQHDGQCQQRKPRVNAGIVQLDQPKVIENPQDRTHQRQNQRHAKSANRAQRGAQIDDVTDHDDQTAQNRNRQVLRTVLRYPSHIVVLSGIVGRGQKAKCKEPACNKAHIEIVPAMVSRLVDPKMAGAASGAATPTDIFRHIRTS